MFLAKISANEEDKILENGLAIAERAGLQAKELAHRLITFAQGGYPVKKIEKLTGIIHDAVEKALKDANVTANVSIAPDLWPAEVDAMQIKQVIENMVTNAREAMPGGGVVDVSAENTVTGTNIRSLEKATTSASLYGTAAPASRGKISPKYLIRISRRKRKKGVAASVWGWPFAIPLSNTIMD